MTSGRACRRTPDGPGPYLVRNWDPEPWIPLTEHRRLDRFTQFALMATQEAFEQSGPLQVEPNRVTIVLATGIGGLESLGDPRPRLRRGRRPRVSPFLIPMMMANAAAADDLDQVRIRWPGVDTGRRMCRRCPVDPRRSPSDPVGIRRRGGRRRHRGRSSQIGFRWFQGGTRPVASPGSPGLSTSIGTGSSWARARPSWSSKPKEAAKARGATILAEMLGGASTADAHHITAPHPDGEGAERAIRLAMEDSGLEPGDISYINAHGTGTDLNDRTEGMVIDRIFGDRQPAVSSIKGTTGHGLGASGSIEARGGRGGNSTQRATRPTSGSSQQDPEIPLTDIVREPRDWEPGPVLSNSFGFGGHNTVLAFGPYSLKVVPCERGTVRPSGRARGRPAPVQRQSRVWSTPEPGIE